MHPEPVANAAAQGGVFTTQQARARGYTADEIRARLTSGRWTRVRHGIYRCSGEVDEYRVATAAALREERLREAGFEVVRMTWAQITRQPEQTAARIRAAFARQAYRSPTGR